MSGLEWRAITLGVLVDFAGSFIASGLLFAPVGASSGATSEEQLNAILAGSIELQAGSLVLGTLFVIAGGFTAARMAKGHPLDQALVVGIADVLYGFLTVFGAPDTAPFWLEAAGLLVAIPAAVLGGYAARMLPKGSRPA